jgi:surface protein
MGYMFYGCANLVTVDVSGFDTPSVITMNQMFRNCTNLTNLDIKHFDITSVSNGSSFLAGSNNALTTTAYDELLEAWAAQDVQPNVAWHFGDAQYTVETVADWHSPRSASSLSIIDNKLVSIADSTAPFGAAQQIDNLIVGKAYKIIGTATCSSASANMWIRVSTTSGLGDEILSINGKERFTVNENFIATAATVYVGALAAGHAANDTLTIDAGMSVTEITNYTQANAASEIEASLEGDNSLTYKNIPQSARELYSLEDDTWTGSNELVVNGDFATDSDWNKGTGWTISNNSLNGASVNVAQAYQAGILTENTWYWVELNLNITNGYIKVKNSAALSTSGYYSFKYFNTGGVDLNIFGYSLFTGSIDNVSVKEIIEVPS